MTSTDIAAPAELLDVDSGQLLPATTENAAAVLMHARAMKDRIAVVVRDAEAWLEEESRRQGTKTFSTPYGKISGAGGPDVSYDPEGLMEALRAAGCPEARINEVVKTTVVYTVDKAVLRQLTSANPAYREAAEKVKTETPKRLTFSVRPTTK